MKRQILGLFAASVLAPYLVAAFFYAGSGLRFGLLGGGGHMAAHEYIAFVGTAGAMAFSLPTMLVSGLLVFLLHMTGLYSCGSVTLTASLVGACFVGRIFLNTPDILIPTCSGALSGAICGWIYWRIAMGRSERSV